LTDIIWSILLVALFLAIASGCVMLSVLFLKQGIFSVIQIFREHNAVGESNARTFSELGLRPKAFADYFNPGLRDYKQEALQLLMANNIVRKTMDNRLYLVEDNPF
jgi:hypothetical protein